MIVSPPVLLILPFFSNIVKETFPEWVILYNSACVATTLTTAALPVSLTVCLIRQIGDKKHDQHTNNNQN